MARIIIALCEHVLYRVLRIRSSPSNSFGQMKALSVSTPGSRHIETNHQQQWPRVSKVTNFSSPRNACPFYARSPSKGQLRVPPRIYIQGH